MPDTDKIAQQRILRAVGIALVIKGHRLTHTLPDRTLRCECGEVLEKTSRSRNILDITADHLAVKIEESLR